VGSEQNGGKGDEEQERDRRRSAAAMSRAFACIGDLHGQLGRLATVVDWLAQRPLTAVLLVGDFAAGPFNRPHSGEAAPPLEAALEMVSRLELPTFYVPGNHDERRQNAPGNVDGLMEVVAGIRIVGIGGAGPQRHGFPYEWSDEDVRRRGVPQCDIILSHAPPARTRLDVLAGTRRHLGSEAVRELAERTQGALVCGHIHEAVGSEQLNRCLCYNTGSLGQPFGKRQVGILDFADSGEPVRLTHHDLEGGGSWTAGSREQRAESNT
jgi:Icc-related predicted phosphoesterase